MTVYIYEGELLTCEMGCDIGVAAKDISLGDPLEIDHFVGWFQHTNIPQPSEVIDPICPTCSANWLKSNPGIRIQVYIGGEWR